MENNLAYNLKHSSCPQHLDASLHAGRRKAGNDDITIIQQSFEHKLPCFFDNIPCRKRSKRNRRLPKQRWKMDSFTFDDHLETVWRSLSKDKRSKFGLLASLCFSVYRRERSKGLNMIKTADIFLKKFVFVPIVCWDHWRLVIFCHFGKSAESEAQTQTRCILLLDSLEMGAQNIVPEIRNFVYDIFKEEGRPELKAAIYRIPLLVPKVPQQRNDVDCGRFVLYFINQFIDADPENFTISNEYPRFMEQKWFDWDKFEQFCDKLERESPVRTWGNGLEKKLPAWTSGKGLKKKSPAQTWGKGVVRRYSQRITKKWATTRKPSRKGAEILSID